MVKQVKANVETVCKKCKTTVHLDQGRAGTQQMNSRKRKGGNGDGGTQDVGNEDKENGKGEDNEEVDGAPSQRGPTEVVEDEVEDPGEGPSKETEKSKRRGRRRINVESDSD